MTAKHEETPIDKLNEDALRLTKLVANFDVDIKKLSVERAKAQKELRGIINKKTTLELKAKASA